MSAQGDTRPREGAGQALLRAWREFRSMRTALVLLLVIGVGAIFGSVFPQRPVSPRRVEQYMADHPAVAPLLDRLGMFDVFGSSWFMALYLALLTALVGCLVPRLRSFARIARARPPRPAPRLDVYRNHAAFDTAADPGRATVVATRVLRRRRFRVAGHGPGVAGAEKGYLREAGSILFHLSFLLLLLGLAYGKGFGYRGQAAIIEGDTWANTRINYDAYDPGRFFDPADLASFSLRLDDFENSFHPNLTPREFVSRVSALDPSGGVTQQQPITVNRPMTVEGVRVFQSDYGYAPVVRVTGESGDVLADGPLLTRRDPATEISTGAIKLPSLDPQVGVQVAFYTGLRVVEGEGGRRLIVNDPRVVQPVLILLPFQGDLHAERAQSIFTLDTTDMRLAADRPLVLEMGASGTLPGGLRVSFTELRQYSVLTLAKDPGVPIVAVAAGLLLAGLLPSLYVTRRRVWVSATATDAGARVELAGIALQGKPAFVAEFQALSDEVRSALDPPAGRAPPDPPAELEPGRLLGRRRA